MKTSLPIAVLIAGLSVTAWAKEVTLTVNTQPGNGPAKESDEMPVGTNETAEVTSIYGYSGSAPPLSIVKNGITNIMTLNPTGKNPTVAGPATIRLTNPGINATWFCTVKIEPESFQPGLTIILPEGTVGVIHVESSTNLLQWQDEWVQTFSNTNQNRFFRLRAERSLP